MDDCNGDLEVLREPNKSIKFDGWAPVRVNLDFALEDVDEDFVARIHRE
jgi:hypothetical protein